MGVDVVCVGFLAPASDAAKAAVGAAGAAAVAVEGIGDAEDFFGPPGRGGGVIVARAVAAVSGRRLPPYFLTRVVALDSSLIVRQSSC